MLVRISAKVEEALRGALENVPRGKEDKITAPLDALDDTERAEALALATVVTAYVMIDVCGNQWPVAASVRRIAEDLATTGKTARRLRLDAEEIHAYLSRVVLGPDQMQDVFPGEPQFTRLPVIVAQGALSVYGPQEIDIWDYLDQIESAIEVASALDESVVPAVVLRARQPKPQTQGES
jgi:hypothetical protein